MNPDHMPIAVELFAQWRRVRGERGETASQTSFSRNWEKLLSDAGLLSALERNEAERDVRALAAAGWLELKTMRYRAHLIERITIPLAVEPLWKQAFGFRPVSDEEAHQIREFPWVPPLAFLRDIRVGISFAELRRLNAYLLTQGSTTGEPADSVPIKERSLQIFGDEKRLDTLIGSAVIRPDRLPLSALNCHEAIEPLGWQRGPTNTGAVIVLENAATWDTYRRWNTERKQFSAVIYGQGNCFAERVTFLREIFRELNGTQTVFYFGDLDAAGLRIPARASQKSQEAGLPAVQPHLPSYRLLLQHADKKSDALEDEPAERGTYNWLGELAEEAWQALGGHHRLAQEHVGWEYLRASASSGL